MIQMQERYIGNLVRLISLHLMTLSYKDDLLKKISCEQKKGISPERKAHLNRLIEKANQQIDHQYEVFARFKLELSEEELKHFEPNIRNWSATQTIRRYY